MAQHLYIDTNVFLTFYHFSKEDLNELKKLTALIESENIKLYVPEQTKNEFNRNREVKIADAIEKVKAIKINTEFPMISHAYAEYREMRKAIKDFEIRKNEIISKMQYEAENETLKADELLSKIFKIATKIKTSDDILNRSVTRYNVGNPPGKNRSYGDAINWESLLDKLPDGADLYFVSDDSDFYSKLDDKKFNKYLLKEWKEQKNADIYCFRRLSEFFKIHYPTITISAETEKEIAIQNLLAAGSFESAKSAIRALRKFEHFSIQQLNDITEAFASNNQIYWIPDDHVVSRTRSELIEPNRDRIDPTRMRDYDYRYR